MRTYELHHFDSVLAPAIDQLFERCSVLFAVNDPSLRSEAGENRAADIYMAAGLAKNLFDKEFRASAAANPASPDDRMLMIRDDQIGAVALLRKYLLQAIDLVRTSQIDAVQNDSPHNAGWAKRAATGSTRGRAADWEALEDETVDFDKSRDDMLAARGAVPENAATTELNRGSFLDLAAAAVEGLNGVLLKIRSELKTRA